MTNQSKNYNYKLLILLSFLFFVFNYFLVFNIFKLDLKNILGSDAEGYFQYLFYFFIKNDITHMSYAAQLDNGMTFNKYTCGIAIFEMPFFFLGLIYNKIFGITHEIKSATYGFVVLLAAITYVYIGLIILYKILRKWFNLLTSLLTVLAIYFATNLFYYTISSPGYAHCYSFFILTLFIYLLDKFLTKPNLLNSLFCGLTLGLAVLMRPTSIFYAFLFLLYGVNSIDLLKKRLFWIIKNLKYFIVIAIFMFIAFIPQMLYWHAVTGNYIVYSYKYSYGQEEHFIYWKNPKIGLVLLGVQNGWLVYTPLFFLFIVGLVWMLIKKQLNAIAITVCFILILYANASWWCYTFSCAFGHRAFIEYYPLLSIPIAFLLSKIFNEKRKVFVKGLMIFLLVIFSFTNLRLSYLHYKDPCWERPSFTWVDFNRALNIVFYIVPQSKGVK